MCGHIETEPDPKLTIVAILMEADRLWCDVGIPLVIEYDTGHATDWREQPRSAVHFDGHAIIGYTTEFGQRRLSKRDHTVFNVESITHLQDALACMRTVTDRLCGRLQTARHVELKAGIVGAQVDGHARIRGNKPFGAVDKHARAGGVVAVDFRYDGIPPCRWCHGGDSERTGRVHLKTKTGLHGTDLIGGSHPGRALETQ